jgi:two-component system response regulator AtoC
VLHEQFDTNTRQLDAALWKALSEAAGNEVAAPGGWPSGPASAPPSRPTPESGPPGEAPRNYQDVKDEFERRNIEAALAASGGNKTRAAKMLGMPLRTLTWKLKRLRTADEES